MTIVAALVTSGGVDGDGGLPDLDLEFGGIGAHRSLFTHSIIAGTVVEGSVYGVATLMRLVYDRLPEGHDQLWDNIERNRETIATAISRGVSAGLAYHLLVDGAIQEGTYHGLPYSMPQEAHDAIAVTNALAEARDLDAKRWTYRAK